MTDLDLSQSVIPKSDQINYEDLPNGATATYTVREVTAGNAEQPYNFLLVETDKAYRPSKTMRKVIIAAWGPLASAYVGRRLTIYGEPSIQFGGKRVGGLRISAMSHIPRPLEVMAQKTRGNRETLTVRPLASSPTTTGGDASTAGASGSEDPAPESLLAAVNRQVKDMQASGSSSFLTTWAQAHGVNPSSKAIVEKWGEEARDLPALMASLPIDVTA